MASTADQSELIPGMLVFRQVVVSGSFSGAGRTLGLSPSAVSRQIDRLERLLNVALVTRSTRNLFITESGQDVFNVASEIASATDSLMSRIEAAMVEPEGLLRVTAPVTIGKILLSSSIAEFLRIYPKIKVDLNFTDNIVDIYKEKFDLSVRITSAPPHDMVARKLFDVEYLLVATTGEVSFELPSHPEDISSTPMITPSDSFFGEEMTFNHTDYSYTVRSTPRLMANNSETLLGAIFSGMGVGVLPNFLASPLIESGQLRLILPEWQINNVTPSSVFLLSHPSKMISAKARAYIEYLEGYASGAWGLDPIALSRESVGVTEVEPQAATPE